jgi:hypothetical protein
MATATTSLLARSTLMARGGPTPAFMLAQVFAAGSAGVAAHVRERARAECVACSQWLLLSARLRSLRAKPG